MAHYGYNAIRQRQKRRESRKKFFASSWSWFRKKGWKIFLVVAVLSVAVWQGWFFIRKFNPMEMGLIIENLASNSRKAHASRMTISMDVSQDGRTLTIVFGDNGDGLAEGFPPERIFEKGFSRTNGSGLGLYTCK